MDSLEKSLFCARLANDKKAKNLVILDLQEKSSVADYFIICSGTSDRHVKAVAGHIEFSLKEKGLPALGIEGVREGRWILLDYDDVIIHIFQEQEREFYDLESLWFDCPRVPFPEADEQ